MKKHEITLPQTSIPLTYCLGARDQIALAFNYYNAIDRDLPLDEIAKQVGSKMQERKAHLVSSAPKHAAFLAKALRTKGIKHDSYGIESYIDKLTNNHPCAVNMGAFYGHTAVCTVEALQAILCPDPRRRIQGLVNSLRTEVRRFEQMLAAELELMQLVNPHIDMGIRNFYVTNIESDNPMITFKPTSASR